MILWIIQLVIFFIQLNRSDRDYEETLDESLSGDGRKRQRFINFIRRRWQRRTPTRRKTYRCPSSDLYSQVHSLEVDDRDWYLLSSKLVITCCECLMNGNGKATVQTVPYHAHTNEDRERDKGLFISPSCPATPAAAAEPEPCRVRDKENHLRPLRAVRCCRRLVRVLAWVECVRTVQYVKEEEEEQLSWVARKCT